MRLWQKIFLCTLALVIFAINLSAGMLLGTTHRQMVSREQERALSEHASAEVSLKSHTLYARLKNNNNILLSPDDLIATLRSEALDFSLAGGGVSLYDRLGERVLSTSPLTQDQEAALRAAAEQERYRVSTLDQEGATYLMVSSVLSLEEQPYTLVTCFDVTPVYALRTQQLAQVQRMGIFSALVISGVLLVMVLVLLRPLDRINEATRQIARGHYTRRIKVRGHSELSELGGNMNRMAQAIEENVSALQAVAEDRRVFIANLAHEMKTPLTSILGFADLLRIQRTIDDATRRDYAGVIVEETRRLRSLSGKLLEMMTLGSAHIERSWVSLPELIHQMAASLEPIFVSAGLTLSCDVVEVELLADPELIKSLFYNLIDNAVKASSPGQAVTFSAQTGEDGLSITLADQGRGVPARDIARITQPFYMVDKARSRKAGGAGLGLALCVEIARVHQATLSIASQVGRGTQIHLNFPPEVIR